MQRLLDYFSFKHFLLTIEGFVNLTYGRRIPIYWVRLLISNWTGENLFSETCRAELSDGLRLERTTGVFVQTVREDHKAQTSL